ncbi:MAG: hypothetical protein IKP66_03085 [Lachnospiraceae bacterium]|nr:hypothetical protein [Lachnospiraceae bacterium]
MKKKTFTFLILFSVLLVLFACNNSYEVINESIVESTCIDKPVETISSSAAGNQEKDGSWFGDLNIVQFGKFEQDGNISNGKEDITWIILEDTGNDRLLISKDVLYAMPFDEKTELGANETNGNWEKSSLRKWLNEDFFNEAFSDYEKLFVSDSYVKNGNVFGINNNDSPFDMGPDTSDKVYILSKDEIRKYLGFEVDGSSEKYMAKPSPYAKSILDEEKNKANIAVWHKEQDYEEVYDGYAEYWIRSSLGNTMMTAKEFFTDIVDKRGHVSNHGFPYYVSKVDKSDNSLKERFYNRGVRPVIRIPGSFIFEKDHFEQVREEKKAQVYDIKSIGDAYEIANYDKSKTYKDFDSVVLGTYEQDGDVANGKEGIEWIILKREDNKALLLSKYVLDYVEYSNILERYTVWKDSRLRAWANHEFYDDSFNEQEKVLIAPTRIKNYDNPVYGNSSGVSTIDKIFVPGFDELMEIYKIDYDECIREPLYDIRHINDNRLATIYTDYAFKKHKKENSNLKSKALVDFWLRNQGRSGEDKKGMSSRAVSVRETIDFKGSPYDTLEYTSGTYKTNLSNPKLGFRPCMWIDLNVLSEFEGSSYDERTDKIFSEELHDPNKYTFENIEEARVVTSYSSKATCMHYDTVTFGAYEQDSELENGKEPIEWIVLDKKGDEYLLLSKYVLDYHQFQNTKVEGKSVSWNDSDIRRWANTEFLDNAFSESEQKNIMQSTIDNTNNDYYSLKSTEDKIFLLSLDEIVNYFGSKNENLTNNKPDTMILPNEKNKSFATMFAKARGVIIGGKLLEGANVYSCGYYTRTMRNTEHSQVMYIKSDGSDDYISAYDTWKRYGFRPAIWVKK